MQYEYKKARGILTTDELNVLGAQGWKLVSMYLEGREYDYVFIRQKMTKSFLCGS